MALHKKSVLRRQNTAGGEGFSFVLLFSFLVPSLPIHCFSVWFLPPLATEFSLIALSRLKQMSHEIPMLMPTRLLIKMTFGVDYQNSLGFPLMFEEEILFEKRGFGQDIAHSAPSVFLFIYILYVYSSWFKVWFSVWWTYLWIFLLCEIREWFSQFPGKFSDDNFRWNDFRVK